MTVIWVRFKKHHPSVRDKVVGKANGVSRDLYLSERGSQMLGLPCCECGTQLSKKAVATGKGIQVDYIRYCRKCKKEYPWARL